jgi:hypothetical protein
MPVETTENYVRVRVRDPDDFQDDSFRIIDIDKDQGIKATIGRLKGEKSTTTQSYLFDKDRWTEAKAEKWVKDHAGKRAKEAIGILEESLLEAGRRHSKKDHDLIKKIKDLLDELEHESAGESGGDESEGVKESGAPGPTESMPLRETIALTEAYDPQTRDLSIIILEAGTNPKKKRHYTDRAVMESAPVFKGVKMFLNHPTREEENQRPEGDLRNWVSTITESWPQEAADGQRARSMGKAHVFDDWLHGRLQDPVFLREVGLSINVPRAECYRRRINGEDGYLVVESIPVEQPRPPSVDWVTYAAQGGRVAQLMESRRDDLMNLDTVTVKDLEQHRPDLVKQLRESGAGKEKDETKTEFASLKETVDGLKDENKKLATKVEASEKLELVRQHVKESKLPDPCQERIIADCKAGLLAGSLVFQDDPAEKKDGKTAQVKLREAVDAKIEAERKYLKEVGGKAKIVGMGDGGEPQSVQESIGQRLGQRMGRPWATDQIAGTREVLAKEGRLTESGPAAKGEPEKPEPDPKEKPKKEE